MRTNEEVLARIAEVQERDVLGFEVETLVEVLPYKLALPYLRVNKSTGAAAVKLLEWEPLDSSREAVLARMLDYMPRAWEKANDKRGISAYRSMRYYNSWVWLAGDDLGDLPQYSRWGKDNLVAICTNYGWDYSKWDDGKREGTLCLE